MDENTTNDIASAVAQLGATESNEKTTLQKISARAQEGLEKGVSWSTADELFGALKDIIAMCQETA